MLSIREARPEDYEMLAAIASLVRSEPLTAEEFSANDRRIAQAGVLHRLVAEDAQGRIVGYGSAEHTPWHPHGKWGIYAAAHPDHRRCGVGAAVYAAAERIVRDGGATALESWCRSDDPAYLAWAERRGFVSDLLRTESVLDLTAWEGSRFTGHVEKVRATGLRLETYDGEAPEHVLRGVYDVDMAIAPDVPDFQPDAPFPTFEVYCNTFMDMSRPTFIAMAFDGDRPVGTSIITYSRLPGRGAYTGLTGVLREYRGRGLALALKLLTVEAAVSKGSPRMRTNNDFENPAMLAVNTKLGYQLVPGPHRLKKHL